MVRRFASVTYPTHGLLILGELDNPNGLGDELLADLASLNTLTHLPDCWGLSVAAHLGEESGEEFWWPYEVSIVHEPAFEDARILAAGSRAIEVCDLLTEVRADGRTVGRTYADRW